MPITYVRLVHSKPDPVVFRSPIEEQIGRAHVLTPVTPISTLFPYTTLFRSMACRRCSRMTKHAHHLRPVGAFEARSGGLPKPNRGADRKSTRLNSSHTDIYSLSLHDALPIYGLPSLFADD